MDHPPTLDAAITAFETLFGSRWLLRKGGCWCAENEADDTITSPPTGNHAADVCRLVCLVLDREASDAT